MQKGQAMDYDAWKTGYYECDPDNYCSECKENQQKQDECADFLDAINKMLFGVTKFDKEKLEFYLEELSWRLQVDFSYQQDMKIFSVNNSQNKIHQFTLDLTKQTINF